MILALFLDKGSLQQNLRCYAVQEKGNSNRTDQSQVVAWKREFKILPGLVQVQFKMLFKMDVLEKQRDHVASHG